VPLRAKVTKWSLLVAKAPPSFEWAAVRGRDLEYQLIKDLLHRGRTGTGGVLLIEGEPGMGKSLLLAEAAKAATAQGYTTVTAVADQFERMIALCPLLLALADVTGPVAAEPAAADLSEPDPRIRAVATVRRSLERLAARDPVLVTVDDLQHADPVTLLALRVLPRQLAVRPVSWILARRRAEQTDAAQVFELLEHDGADRLPLGPLTEPATADVITDLLGVIPDRSLLALASGAGGNPRLITELLRGLREENMLLTSPAGAVAVTQRLPGRVRALCQRQIGSLPPRTRQLIEASVVLGQSFAVEDAAELVGQPPAAVLPAISEAIAAGILVPAGETLTFRDALVWRAVAEAMPASVSRALHHQAGELFLDLGDPARAAEHLISGARQGDRRVLRELDDAARRVLTASPREAAGLAARALELTAPGDPERAGRAVTAVQALLAARRLRDAETVITSSLAGPPLPARQRAQLRSAQVSLLNLSGHPGRARAEADDLLAEPDLPAAMRDDVTLGLLEALGELPDLAAAEQRARGIVRQASRARGPGRPSGAVVAAAKALQATVKWNRGDIAASLDLLREAVSQAPEAVSQPPAGPGPVRGRGAPQDPLAGYDPAPRHPRHRLLLVLASRLIDVRLVDEASALIGGSPPDDDGPGLGVIRTGPSGPSLLRARLHLAAGRVEAAKSEVEAALGTDPPADGFPSAMLARCLLGVIALRRGDLASAYQALDWVSPRLAVAGSSHAGVLCRLFAAQLAAARDGPAAAMRVADGIYDLVKDVRWPLIHDPGIAPWLVRTALAAGEAKRAALAGDAAAALGRLNAGFPAVAAACAHAKGLLTSDAGLLEHAARTQPDAWAAASAAADLAALLTGEHRETEAIAWLDGAHDNFLASGANRDAARARGMLRALGVRRGRWRAAQRSRLPGSTLCPPATPQTPMAGAPERVSSHPTRAQGLDGLSEAERGIAELVCQGLTNREIAERTFVSANTVAFHLRNIYRKLGIASRVQLARVILAGDGIR
jgi:DNA-binding NarL/FixJ family response regulator